MCMHTRMLFEKGKELQIVLKRCGREIKREEYSSVVFEAVQENFFLFIGVCF